MTGSTQSHTKKPVDIDDEYKHPLYFFDEPVFLMTAEALSHQPPKINDAASVVIFATLINTQFRKKIGCHVSYTTKEIEDSVTMSGCISKFTGLLDNFELIVSSESCPKNIVGPINPFRKEMSLLITATYKAGDVPCRIKIVTSDEKHTLLEKLKTQFEFPVDVIPLSKAVAEIKEIHDSLKANPYFKN